MNKRLSNIGTFQDTSNDFLLSFKAVATGIGISPGVTSSCPTCLTPSCFAFTYQSASPVQFNDHQCVSSFSCPRTWASQDQKWSWNWCEPCLCTWLTCPIKILPDIAHHSSFWNGKTLSTESCTAENSTWSCRRWDYIFKESHTQLPLLITVGQYIGERTVVICTS